MDDLISRQAVLDYIRDNYKKWFVNDDAFMQCVNGIKVSVPVTPKQRWIPVREGLPEEYGVYLVTIGDSTDFCIWNKKEWGWESRKGWEPNIEITAWMPLPEPWKGESE